MRSFFVGALVWTCAGEAVMALPAIEACRNTLRQTVEGPIEPERLKVIREIVVEAERSLERNSHAEFGSIVGLKRELNDFAKRFERQSESEELTMLFLAVDRLRGISMDRFVDRSLSLFLKDPADPTRQAELQRWVLHIDHSELIASQINAWIEHPSSTPSVGMKGFVIQAIQNLKKGLWRLEDDGKIEGLRPFRNSVLIFESALETLKNRGV